MASRVYPITKSPAALEQLAGVPAGTYARLQEIDAKEQEEIKGLSIFDADPIQYKYHCMKHDDPHLGTLDSFLTYGWGRLRDEYDLLHDYPEFWEVETEGEHAGRKYLAPAGCTKSIAATKALADTMGIGISQLALAEGLCWN